LVRIVKMTRHDAPPCSPAVTGRAGDNLRSYSQAGGELFLIAQMQAAVNPIKIFPIGIVAVSLEGFEAPWKDR